MFLKLLRCFSLLGLLIVLPLEASAQVSSENTSSPFPWSYAVDKDGNTESIRSYLLIPEPDKQIQIWSHCKKFSGEARYGNCKHKLHFIPENKTVILHKGEDVLLSSSRFGDIATINYGCCASPDTVTFYNNEIQPIGRLLIYADNTHNKGWLDSPSNFNNVTSGGIFLEKIDDLKDSPAYFILQKEGTTIKKTPIDVTFTDPKECNAWLFKSYNNATN